MKLFAPKANWDMKSSDSWWPMLGSMPTVTGKRISEETALTFAAMSCGTRIISETLASLPCNLMERVDGRTNRVAERTLQKVIHDEPNPEQDSVVWTDSQVSLQVLWGNDYAEVVRDMTGEVVALWPIHPSRIPLRNITRNPTEPRGWDEIQAGEPGEIIYYVNNDDGSTTPIPASRMLHVPGVLSSNGITGQSLVRLLANPIAIGMATEEHAGALFRNGAVTNLILKSKKTVGLETAERLRQQWQRCFGGGPGVSNHYKTLILEDEMDAMPISMNAEETQLVLSRQFSVNDVARGLRLPPHLLGDLTRSTNNNIEHQALEFVIYSMLPWIVRREKAMNRQLLSNGEKSKFYFKYNVMGLLRGDHAARAHFYTSLFNIGVYSVNDVRELEDMNPVEGGDQRFIPGNNLTPLDKAAELADAQIDALKQPATAPSPSTNGSSPNNENHFRLRELRRLQEKLILDVELRTAAMQQHVTEQVGPLAAKLDAVPGVVQESVAALANQAMETRNTHENDEITAKMVEIERKSAEIDEKLRLERETTDKVLILSLKRAIDKLAEWESKSLDKAIEKPREWADWRHKFYMRFRKYFVNDLGEYVESANACGIVLDLDWGADRYAGASISDLKTLDESAKDNFHDRIKECCDHFRKRQWTDRSQVLAVEMVQRGRKLFEERKQQSCAVS